MDFLGIGVPELIVIIILALIFIGPRDMPRLAGQLAKFLRDLRMMSEGFTAEWRREINAVTRVEGLKELQEELVSTKQTLQQAGQNLKQAVTVDLDDLVSDPDPAASEAPAVSTGSTGEMDTQATTPPKDKELPGEGLSGPDEIGSRTIHPPETTSAEFAAINNIPNTLSPNQANDPPAGKARLDSKAEATPAKSATTEETSSSE